ncbi:MAG TPA: hypothetical protein VLT60_06155 [Usitatibacter sp.]|nr:hypothetical protein [Usitatibacter sp.]
MKIASAFGAIAVALALPAGATTTYRVDDSLTLPQESNQAMKWRSLAPSRAVGNAVEGTSVITIRLNTAPWLNRMGKIYMALPEQPIGQVTAEWTTQGRLLPGSLISGNRTLVYSGPIKSDMLEDTIALKITADGRRLIQAQRLQFYFEIDVD